MALIRSLSESSVERYRTHDPIDAEYFLHENEGRRLLQINMRGRTEAREFPEKISQSVQFDEASARTLYDAMKRHFGFD